MSNRDRLPTTVGLRRKRPAPFAQQRRSAATAGRSSSSVASTSSNGSFSKRVAPGEIPYVTPNAGRTRYYADRFYLDAPTSLLEYQVSKNNHHNNASSSEQQLYCNKCGEKKEGPPPRIRYDHNRNRLPPPSKSEDENRLPLFDKAEFVNSLDLAAVIIGTYTLGDLDYLSETFPMLFPSSSSLQHNHVPTLVLHGQKGFYLEKKEKDTVMEAVKSSIHDEKQQQDIKDEPVLPIRGGGSSQSSILSSQSPVIKQPLECRNDNNDDGGDATSNIGDDDSKGQVLAREGKEKKQQFFMYEGTKVPLRNTPKRKRRRGRKRVKLDEEEDDDEKMVAESCTAARGEKDEKVHCDDGNNMGNQDSLCKKEEEKTTAPPINNTMASKEPIPCMPDPTAVPLPPSMQSALPPEPPQVATKGLTEPLYSDYVDSSQSQDNLMRPGDEEELVRRRWDKIQPTPLFGGEVFFTRVFPGWVKGQEKFKAETKSSAMPEETLSAAAGTTVKNEGGNAEYSDDEELAYEAAFDEIIGERKRSKNPDIKTELGVHHPKFMLLFEKSGSIVVIVSTSNLTPPTALDGSWVQRFDARHESQYDEYNRSDVDWGMPSDFGAILTDFLSKQSDAAADGSMLPDIFLRRYVKGLSLDGLKCRYKFEDAQVHLVSTVPGHYQGSIPRKGLNPTLSTYKPKITYGPQRVSFILSRLLDAYHMQLAANNSKKSRRLVGPMWIPKRLFPAIERLVFQPTSLGGNWTRESLEEVVEKYLQKDIEEGTKDEDLLEKTDIIWPSEDFFALMKEKRSAVWELNQHTKAASIIRRRMQAEKKKPIRERNHVFLSSDAFARLDRAVISRMALFETSHPLQMPFTSSNLHIKSIYRVLDLQNNQNSKSSECTDGKELFSWFMLTSACLSKGAQGKATLRRGPEEHDEMSYSNFELGVLFVSRLQEYDSDRLYVYDPSLKGCQCGSKDKNHKARLRSSTPNNPLFLDSVRKVHLPVPFKTRAKSYQDDEDYDFFSSTPYFHEVTDGTKGNMRLTPLGQKLASEQNK